LQKKLEHPKGIEEAEFDEAFAEQGCRADWGVGPALLDAWSAPEATSMRRKEQNRHKLLKKNVP